MMRFFLKIMALLKKPDVPIRKRLMAGVLNGQFTFQPEDLSEISSRRPGL